MRNTLLVTVVALATVISIASCSDGSSGPLDITAPPSTGTSPVASVEVVLDKHELDVGETAQASVELRDAADHSLSGRAVRWVSLDTAVVRVSASGIITAIEQGTAIITATSGTRTGSVRVTASKRGSGRVAKVEISATRNNLLVGDTVSTTVIVSDAQGRVINNPSVAYESDNPMIASVSPSGIVTAVAEGTARIQATSGGVTASMTFSVSTPQPTAVLLALTLTPGATVVPPEGTVQFGVSGSWSDGSSAVPAVTYVATGGSINAGGVYAAGTNAGNFRVIATQQGGTKADTALVTISSPVVTLLALALAPASVTLAPGASRQFTVTGEWSDGSTSAVAVTYAATGGTITTAGLYTAGASPGTFRVIATQQGGLKSDTAVITVAPPEPVSLALLVQPSGTVSSLALTQQPVVELRDSQNLPVPRSGVLVTAAVATGAGTLGGTLTVSTNAQGRAAYSDLKITGTGPHSLVFTAPGLQSVTSSTLTLAAPTLRSLASARGFSIGAAVRDTAFAKDAKYRQTLAEQYNSIVPEDATDFWPIHPGPTQYSFAAADALVNFAQANGMSFHGHHLVWYSWIPTWVTSGGYTKEQLRSILKDHITTVVGRYKGKVASWDVVNEVEDDYGTGLRKSFWVDNLGPEYIDSAFVWARRADPGAKLFINDYATETVNPKSTAILELAKALRSRGVPIDGVGFQVHIYQQFSPAPSGAQVQSNLQRFADAGFDIRITEMDVDIPDSAGATALAAQADIYAGVLDACLKVSRCTELTTWGFSDRYSYVPVVYPGYGRALPFDLNYQGKPAFDSMIARLRQP